MRLAEALQEVPLFSGLPPGDRDRLLDGMSPLSLPAGSLIISQGDAPDEEYFASRIADMELEAAQQEKDALATYGMLEGLDPRVSPLHRALAVWGLKADDIGVLSIHGTSTAANEKNETHLWHDVFTTIGRTPGNAVPVMAQKSLVGHSKGGSAAWQAIGLMQSVVSGIVPGNRNAE